MTQFFFLLVFETMTGNIEIIMNKYKTISPQSDEKSLSDCIHHRLARNNKGYASLDQPDCPPVAMSNNKSIIFIKLPKSQTKAIKNFKLSFYDSCSKREKQRRRNVMRQSHFPIFSCKKNGIPNNKDNLVRMTELQKRETRRKGFPDIICSPGKLDYGHLESFILGPEQKEQKQLQAIEMDTFGQRSTLKCDDVNIVRNKYVQPRQISFRIVKKGEVLLRNRSHRNCEERDYNLLFPKFKMQKQIQQHMNRYNKKDFFQTNLNCFKTTLFPDKRVCFKHGPNKKCECSKEHISNLFEPRKMKRINFSNLLDLQDGKDMRNTLYVNPEKREDEAEQCTPWETDKFMQD